MPLAVTDRPPDAAVLPPTNRRVVDSTHRRDLHAEMWNEIFNKNENNTIS